MMHKFCQVCSRLFEKPSTCSKKDWVSRKYCSKQCADKAPRSEDTKRKQSIAKENYVPWNKGLPMREETKDKFRKLFKGRKLSEETKKKMLGRRPWNKIGENGVTSTNERIRKSPAYKEWRKKVFERDDYTCQNCGTRGGNMHADHIKPFFAYPELRFEVSNGRTLCIPCHRATDTYGSRHYYKILKAI